MTQHLPWPVVVTYCVYAVFAAQQKTAVRSFQGASVAYSFALGSFAIFTMIFGVGFLIYYGHRTTWWSPLILYGVGLVIYILTGGIRLVNSRPAVSVWAFLSFLAVPVCAALLIHFTP